MKTVNRERPRSKSLAWAWGTASLLFGLFVVYFGIHCFKYPWVGDIHLHAATVASFYVSLTNPPHEALAVPESEYHTPYILAVAVLGKLLAVTPYRALQLAGVANLVLYALSIVVFFRTFSLTPSWPIAASLFLPISLFVRDRFYLWSSETGYPSMRVIQSYPSLFAWGLALLLMATAARFLRSGRARLLVAILGATPVLLLSHPLTGGWTLSMLGTLGLVTLISRGTGATVPVPGRVPLHRVAALALAVAAGCALALLWPYFHLLRLGSLAGAPEGSPFADHPFQDLRGVYLAAPIAAVLFVRLRKHVFLLAAFAATLTLLTVFRAFGLQYLNRFAFFMGFFAQAAVAEMVALTVCALLLRDERARSLLSGWESRVLASIGMAAAVFLTVTSPGFALAKQEGRPLLGVRELLQQPSPHELFNRQMRFLVGHVDRRDTVLTPVERAVWDLSAQTGARVLAAPNAFIVPDFAERSRAVSEFFAPTTSPGVRHEILERYGVTAVLVPPPCTSLRPILEERLGAPALVSEGHALYYTPKGRALRGGPWP